MNNIEISRTHGSYFRVYKVGEKWAEPISPRDFSSIGDARAWVRARTDCAQTKS